MTTLLDDVDTFFAQYWEQELLHLPGQVVDVPARLTDIDHLLSDHVLTTSTVALSAEGRLLDPHRFTVDPTPLVTRGDGEQSVIDPDRLLAEFQHGATVVFQRVEDYLPAAAEVAQALTTLVGHPVRGNMFLTPPGSPGLPPHMDGADVFVIQCVGVKRWEIWKRNVVRPLCEDEWETPEESDPDFVIDLQPGDLLYVPRGWRHRVGANAETSLSASFNVRTITRAHVARAALEKANESEEMRLALTPSAMRDPNARRAEISGVLTTLSEAIASIDPAELIGAVDELVHQVRQPKPSVTLVAAIDAIGLTDNHLLRLASDVTVEDNTLRRNDAEVTPPRQFIVALRKAGSDPTRVGEMRGSLPLEAAEPLLLRLLTDGWVTAA